MKSPALTATPSGVRTNTFPMPAAAGTVTVRLVPLAAVTSALVLPNVTTSLAAVELKPLPVTMTCVPAGPLVGDIDVITGAVGAAWTVNGSGLLADPADVDTVTVPLVAPPGTVTTRLLTEADTTAALVPLNLTVSPLAAGLNPAPVIVTCVPAGPASGAAPRIVTLVADPRPIEARSLTRS